MPRFWVAAAAALVFCVELGCDTGPHSAAGFRLPESGSVERGQTAFLAYECQSCHSLDGKDVEGKPAVGKLVKLGGVRSQPMTDGYLVTSIINPSHRVARGNEGGDMLSHHRTTMPEFADRMTVRELTDLVAFLQSRYLVQPLRSTPVVY